MIPIIILTIWVGTLLFLEFVMKPRNSWVHEQRCLLNKRVYDICTDPTNIGLASSAHYDILMNHYWTYNKMFYHFWIWDMNKMRN